MDVRATAAPPHGRLRKLILLRATQAAELVDNLLGPGVNPGEVVVVRVGRQSSRSVPRAM